MMSSDARKAKSNLHFGFDMVNPYLSWAIVLLSPLVIWSTYLIRVLDDSQMCVADTFAFLSSSLIPLRLMFIPLFLLYMQQLLRNNFTAAFVVRKKDRRSIWNAQCIKLFACSVLYTALIGLNSWWSARTLFTEVMNWDSFRSNYFFNTGTVNVTLTFTQLVSAFFISLWLQLFGSGLLFLLLMWLTGHALIPWQIIMALVAWSTWGSLEPIPSRPLFFDWMQITFHEWNLQVIPRNFIIAFLLILTLYIMGGFFSRRKEFYG